MTATHIATCNCGSVRIIANGPPVRVGLCHCTTCRKGSGAPFTANAIWTADCVTVEGKTSNWKAATVARHFLSVVRVAAIRRLRWRRCNLTRCV